MFIILRSISSDARRAVSAVNVGVAMLLLCAAGCSNYTITGRVVKGGIPMVSIVSADDAALQVGDAVPYAEVSLFRDPERLNREQVALVRSGSDGRFVMPVPSFGAGWMEEVWEIRGEARGHRRAEQIIALPRSMKGREILIILPEGSNAPDPRDLNPLDEIQRYR